MYSSETNYGFSFQRAYLDSYRIQISYFLVSSDSSSSSLHNPLTPTPQGPRFTSLTKVFLPY